MNSLDLSLHIYKTGIKVNPARKDIVWIEMITYRIFNRVPSTWSLFKKWWCYILSKGESFVAGGTDIWMQRFVYLDQDGTAQFTRDAWRSSYLNGKLSRGEPPLSVLKRSFFFLHILMWGRILGLQDFYKWDHWQCFSSVTVYLLHSITKQPQ